MAASIGETITNNLFFQKKHGKHDDHTIILLWIMENTVIIPRSCPESWRPCQETWPSCRHQGMTMTLFRHDHAMIIARSWLDSHVFPIQGALTASEILKRVWIYFFLSKYTKFWKEFSKFSISNFWFLKIQLKTTTFSCKKLATCLIFEQDIVAAHLQILRSTLPAQTTLRCWK